MQLLKIGLFLVAFATALPSLSGSYAGIGFSQTKDNGKLNSTSIEAISGESNKFQHPIEGHIVLVPEKSTGPSAKFGAISFGVGVLYGTDIGKSGIGIFAKAGIHHWQYKISTNDVITSESGESLFYGVSLVDYGVSKDMTVRVGYNIYPMGDTKINTTGLVAVFDY